jgi:hypothetical protein
MLSTYGNESNALASMAPSGITRAARTVGRRSAQRIDASFGQIGNDSGTRNHRELAVDHVFRFAEGCEYLRVIGDAHSDAPFSRGCQRTSIVPNHFLRHASVNNRSQGDALWMQQKS